MLSFHPTVVFSWAKWSLRLLSTSRRTQTPPIQHTLYFPHRDRSKIRWETYYVARKSWLGKHKHFHPSFYVPTKTGPRLTWIEHDKIVQSAFPSNIQRLEKQDRRKEVLTATASTSAGAQTESDKLYVNGANGYCKIYLVRHCKDILIQVHGSTSRKVKQVVCARFPLYSGQILGAVGGEP